MIARWLSRRGKRAGIYGMRLHLIRHPLGATDGIRRAARGECAGSPRPCGCAAHLRDAGRRAWRGVRAAAWRSGELGDSTLQESARPPALSCADRRGHGWVKSSSNRAGRRSTW